MSELLNHKNVQKIIKPFLDNGYRVKSFKPNFESPVYSEATPKDEDCLAIFSASYATDEIKAKWNIKEFKLAGKVDSASGLGTTEYHIVEFEADEHIGYMVLKVMNGVFVNKGKIVTKENDVKLFEAGFTSKKFYDHFGEYKVFNQTEFNEWKKYQQKTNPNSFLLR